MPSGRLTALQERVLVALAPLEPRWTLTGGGALVGFHLGHRTTRDLDLFWHGRAELGELGREVRRRLESAKIGAESLQASPAFERLRLRADDEELIIDLVAEPVAVVDPPTEIQFHSTRILVDTKHEILVNKLCTLLHRRELRDLLDIRELLASGAELQVALLDAPRKDGGFSPLMAAWTLEGMNLRELGAVAALTPQACDELERFRRELMRLLTEAARP